ncbi:MAG: hypothetical protein OXN27_17695 [Candidatus Poribacteria bacterium]|nr:hypothetical protein [Candidatus Poribacteria bacterium]
MNETEKRDSGSETHQNLSDTLKDAVKPNFRLLHLKKALRKALGFTAGLIYFRKLH